MTPAKPLRGATLRRRLEELDDEFAAMLSRKGVLILRQATDVKGEPAVASITPRALKQWLARERAWDAERGRIVGVGEIWLRHALRRRRRSVGCRGATIVVSGEIAKC